VAAVFWPSKSLPESFPSDQGSVQPTGDDAPQLPAVTKKPQDLKDTSPDHAATLDEAAALLPSVKDDPAKQDKFASLVLSLLDGSPIDPASIDEVTTQTRLDSMRKELRVYNTAMHRAAFALPTYVHALLQLTDRDEPPTSADLRAAGHPLPGVIA